MWRYRSGCRRRRRTPVTLERAGRRCSSAAARREHGFRDLRVKEEGANPTDRQGPRTRRRGDTCRARGAQRLVVPDGRQRRRGARGLRRARRPRGAGVRAGHHATHDPRPDPELRWRLVLVDGHIGDCGAAARAYATETGALDVSPWREPYVSRARKPRARARGAARLDPARCDRVPTGGGTGLIGMWKAFAELTRAAGSTESRPASTACSRGVRARRQRIRGGTQAARLGPTHGPSRGLRVPAPLGDRLMLRALRESGGGAWRCRTSSLARRPATCRPSRALMRLRKAGLRSREPSSSSAGMLHPDDRNRESSIPARVALPGLTRYIPVA